MSSVTATFNELSEQMFRDQKSDSVRQKLAGVPGLSMETDFAGTYAVGSRVGQLQVTMFNLLRIHFAPPARAAAAAALEATHMLPGNMRLAMGERGPCVMADVRVEAEVDLSHVFAIHEVGVRLGLRGKSSKLSPALAPSNTEVEMAIAGAKFEEDAIVRHDNGWQLQPKVFGQPMPVEARLEGESLRLWRVLLPKLPGDALLEPIADQALRHNARLRQCRFASTGSQLVAEARLHAGCVTPAALEAAVRAVAVVDRHCRRSLEVLTERPEAAKVYREVLLKAD